MSMLSEESRRDFSFPFDVVGAGAGAGASAAALPLLSLFDATAVSWPGLSTSILSPPASLLPLFFLSWPPSSPPPPPPPVPLRLPAPDPARLSLPLTGLVLVLVLVLASTSPFPSPPPPPPLPLPPFVVDPLPLPRPPRPLFPRPLPLPATFFRSYSSLAAAISASLFRSMQEACERAALELLRERSVCVCVCRKINQQRYVRNVRKEQSERGPVENDVKVACWGENDRPTLYFSLFSLLLFVSFPVDSFDPAASCHKAKDGARRCLQPGRLLSLNKGRGPMLESISGLAQRLQVEQRGVATGSGAVREGNDRSAHAER